MKLLTKHDTDFVIQDLKTFRRRRTHQTCDRNIAKKRESIDEAMGWSAIERPSTSTVIFSYSLTAKLLTGIGIDNKFVLAKFR